MPACITIMHCAYFTICIVWHNDTPIIIFHIIVHSLLSSPFVHMHTQVLMGQLVGDSMNSSLYCSWLFSRVYTSSVSTSCVRASCKICVHGGCHSISFCLDIDSHSDSDEVAAYVPAVSPTPNVEDSGQLQNEYKSVFR